MTPKDATQVVAKWSNYDVSKWLTVVLFPYSHEDAEWFINEKLAGRSVSWSVWLGRTLIGNIGIEPTLGYWFAQTAWGFGYATEAAVAICDYRFQTTDADTIESEYFVDNTGSRNVLRKLGFRPTTRHMTHSKARDQEVLSQKMRLTRADWTARDA